MPIFALPLALFALSALPALAAVYFLRSRHKRQEVSSLLLWPKEALPKGGGRKASPLRSSWLLLLELLILALLALAAAGPVIGSAAGRRQVCVVLDDCVAMRAHDASGGSARARAKKALLDEMEKIGRFEAQVVIAGVRPRVAGTAASLEALAQLLGEPDAPQARWACLSEASDLQAALTLIGQTASPGSVTLVLSDRVPAAELPAGVRFVAVGQPLANVGITAAARSEGRVLVEVSNFSKTSAQAQVNVEASDGRGGWLKVADAPANMTAGGRTTLALKVDLDQMLRVRLASPDALDEDNAVELLPQAQRKLKVKVEVENKNLRQQIERALNAAGAAQVEAGEHLLITDGPVPMSIAENEQRRRALSPAPGVWEWRITTGDIAPEPVPDTVTQAEPAPEQPKPVVQAFSGPYILNHTHPLTRGLSLEGVVWGLPVPGLQAQVNDEEIIGLGDRPLLTDQLFPSGEHRLRSALAPDISTLAQTPAFPVLISNLVDWRLDHEPGLRRANWRQGESVRVAVSPGDGAWELTAPDGGKTLWHGGPVIEIPASKAGLYAFGPNAQLRSVAPFQFRVNLCSADASDLRLATMAQVGAWPASTLLEGRLQAAFVLILLALALLALHAHLVKKGSEG